MEKKQTKKVTIAAGAVTPKKKKKKYYPPKPKQPSDKVKQKLAERGVEPFVQPEPASFVWAEEKEPTWLQRVVAWLTSIGK
jgi:hypothetical protein